MITITFVSNNVRGTPREFDTNDTQEALNQFAAKLYHESGTKYPEENAVFAVVIERDDHKLDRGQVAIKLREIFNMELCRHASELRRSGS